MDNEIMNTFEAEIYSQLASDVLEKNDEPLLLIYLYEEPKTCFTRIQGRNRLMEKNLNLKYIE